MPDPNEMLADLRRCYTQWAESDPNSVDEQSWATQLAHQFTELDEHLRTGGDLPADWDVGAETDDEYPEFPND